ncbi:helix-turn-helix domain-containing protein [Bosea sp. CS1GBMeth4]|uniref:helix-turn-helix domain-containing protein n=1 Tax=Bosea sp. CS1GBMeth4 TaxID=1892849 RepID=UPI0016445D77|nr:helix-turn-helix domain-containing protein [Bosea sp. CS1GBMeth4]
MAGQQLPEQQAGRPGADDDDLGVHGALPQQSGAQRARYFHAKVPPRLLDRNGAFTQRLGRNEHRMLLMALASVPAYWLYDEPRDQRFPDALHIERISARSAPRDWRIEPHRHQDMAQFFLIASGGGLVRIDGAAHRLSPGTVMLLPPLAIHEFRFEPGTEGFVVSVAMSTLTPLIEAEPALGAALGEPFVAARGPKEQSIAELATAMEGALAEFGRNRGGRELALAAHARLIAIWFARAARSHAVANGGASDARAALVRRFVERVESHFHTHEPLAAYASALGVTGPHLTRICREVLGHSAMRVIQGRLMIEARRDLVYTRSPVSQIAFRLGFSDPAYFSRFFAARAGMSPSEYRAAG